MPLLFSRRKKEQKKQPRVTTFRAEQEKQVVEAVEAGLFPVRVASRNGAKTAQFALKMALVAIVVVAVASYFGLVDPIRQFLQPIQSGNGTLIVSSDYVRANVSLNGKDLGQTPFTGENIPAGRHKVKVQAAENTNNFFQASEVEVVINPNNTTIVKANPGPSQSLFSYTVISSEDREAGDSLLIIKALPQDVRVSIDGNSMGNAPYITETISEGAHQLMLDKTGYKPVLIDITIANDKTVSVETKLYQYQITLER